MSINGHAVVAALGFAALVLLLHRVMRLSARGEYDDGTFVASAVGVMVLGVAGMVLLFRNTHRV